MKKIISLALALTLLLTPLSAYGAEFGVDISHNNDAIDFVEVKNSGNRFVMIRLGYYNHLDTKFWENVQAVYEAGLDFGVYLYSYAFNSEEAMTEAAFVIETLKELGDYAERFTLPVAYDLEDSQLIPCGRKQITENMRLFCDKIKAAGYVPMVYSQSDFFKNYIDLNVAYENGYKLWLAKWESTPDLSAKKEIAPGIYADLWQYASGDKNATGMDNLDKNVCFDLKALQRTVLPKVNNTAFKAVRSSKSAITLKWKKAQDVTGYQLQYGTKKSFKGKSVKTVWITKQKTVQKKLKRLKRKTRYYVRIRTYKTVNGKKYFGKWKSKSIKTK